MNERMEVDVSRQETAFEALEKMPPYPGDLVFRMDDVDGEEYVKKLTEEMDAIDLDSIPFDKWDFVMAFFLAIIEVAGDFFLGDPAFKYSLANKNGPFVKWLDKFHGSLDHDGSPLDYQGPAESDTLPWNGGKDTALPDEAETPGFGGGGHRARTFGHDSLPIARLLFGAKGKKDGEEETDKGSAAKAYNGFLLLRDVIGCGFAVFQISSGKFIDCVFTKQGVYRWIIRSTNQYGNPYESCNLFVAIFKYMKHMAADFCSSTSLPVPGFSLLTHWPDRDVEAYAMKLYRNGMNLRTMMLDGIPVGLVEILMRLYVHARYADSGWSDDAEDHKLDKMLLLTHGITAAVNIGKVVISKNPARLNLILIARVCNLVWKEIVAEASLTNRHMEKMEAGVLKARLASMKTLVLLDQAMYETANYDRIIRESRRRVEDMLEQDRAKNAAMQAEIDGIMSKLEARKENA